MANKCKTCKSEGFEVSVLGPDRCTFCDGTEGGNPPDLTETELQNLKDAIKGWTPDARRVGPMHGYWDFIFDADALIKGNQTYLTGTRRYVYDELMKRRVT